jgi:predicted metal-binding protein
MSTDFNMDHVLEEIKTYAVKNAVVFDVERISFSEEVRKYCEMNSCGQYGKNWACPPGVGPLSELSRKARCYQKGLIIQTLHYIKSSFDLKGMMAAKEKHDDVLRQVYQRAQEGGMGESLLLGAGHCHICSACTYADGQPCRCPEEAIASLEAYGIDVVKLAKDAGIPYHHGKGSVSYVGMILYNPHEGKAC